MQDILARMGNDEIFLIIVLMTSAIVGLTVFFTLQWRKLRQTELDAALKQDMLNRGMSAYDIKLVLEASGAANLAQEKTGATPEANKDPIIEVHHLARGIERAMLAKVKQVLTRVAARL